MIDPYRMVFVNVVSLLTLLCLLGLWKYIFHKKTKSIYIVLLFSILPIISIFRKGVYESGDFNLQIYGTIDFYNSLSNGVLLPRWGSELNATYGHPVFIFASNLQYYLMSFIHALDLSFIGSAKIVLILFFILSGLSMFYFVKNKFGEKAATVASIFYLYTPYHLIDLHFRASFGDIIAFALYPLSFLYATNLLEKLNLKNFILLSLSIFFLIIAHPITMPAIIYLSIYIIFLYFIRYRNIKNLAITLLGISYGGLLSTFYWLPLITESKFTYDGAYVNNVTLQNFSDLLFSTWRFGFLFQGPYGELSFLIGYAHIAIILIAFYLLFKSKKLNFELKIISFLIASTFIILFLITKYSESVWKILPLLESIQFSYRLLFITTFTSSLLAGLVVKKIKHKPLIAIIFIVVIGSTILNWGNRRTIPEIDDEYLIANVPYSTFQGEGNPPVQPIWRDFKDPWMKKIPDAKLVPIDITSISIKELKTLPNYSEFLVYSKTPITLRRNLFYFPGWKAYVNEYETEINYKNDGIIHINLEPGLHNVKFVFEDTKEVKTANLISLFGFLLLFLIIFVNFLKKIRKNN